MSINHNDNQPNNFVYYHLPKKCDSVLNTVFSKTFKANGRIIPPFLLISAVFKVTQLSLEAIRQQLEERNFITESPYCNGRGNGSRGVSSLYHNGK